MPRIIEHRFANIEGGQRSGGGMRSPTIAEYGAPGTAVSGPAGIAPVADFGGIGRSLAGTASVIADKAQQRQEQSELSDINATLAQVRAEWTAEMEKRARAAPLGSTDFVDQFNQDFRNALGELGGRYSTRVGNLAWNQHSRVLEAQFGLTAIQVQSDLAGAKVREDLESAARLNGNTLRHDPSQFESVLSQTTALIDTPAYTAALPAEERAKLKGAIASDLAEAAFNGLVRQNPSVALQQLESGAFDEFVDADRALRLQATAETALRAREIETNRAIVAAERAEKAASEAAMDRYIADVFSDTPKASAVDIATDDQLTPQAKLTMLGVLERSNKPDPLSQVSHETASELFRRIHLPDGHPDKITDETPLNDAYIGEQLNRTDLDWLRKDFQSARTPEGDALGRRRQAFFDAIEQQINPRSMWGLPTSTNGGESFYMFQEEARRREQQFRNEGKDPFSLYDPASSDYLGRDDRLRSYKSPLAQQMDDLLQGIDLGPAAPTAIEQPAETQAADVSRATATATGQDGRKIYLIDGVWQFATGQAVETTQTLMIDGVEKPVQETKTVDGVTYYKVDGTWYKQ